MAVNNSINNTAYVFTSTTTIGAGTGITCTLNDITATAGNFVATAGIITLGNIAASAVASDVTFKKSRAAGVITTGDALGQINFSGHDGVGYINGARITSTSSGTIAADRIPADLKFYTHPDNAGSPNPLLRLTIASTGCHTIAAPDSGVALTITAGGFTVTSGSTTLTPLAGTNGGVMVSSTAGVLSHVENPTTNGQLLISKSDGTDPIWASITAGAGISVTPGANSITIATTGGVSWIEAIADVAPLIVNTGYITNKAGTACSMALPATSLVGDVIEVVGKGATGWIITQAATQYIVFGNQTTTVGVAGSLASTHQRDSLEMVCVEANKGWTLKSAIGNMTLA